MDNTPLPLGESLALARVLKTRTGKYLARAAGQQRLENAIKAAKIVYAKNCHIDPLAVKWKSQVSYVLQHKFGHGMFWCEMLWRASKIALDYYSKMDAHNEW